MTLGRDASDTANVFTGTERTRLSIGAGWPSRRNSRKSTESAPAGPVQNLEPVNDIEQASSCGLQLCAASLP